MMRFLTCAVLFLATLLTVSPANAQGISVTPETDVEVTCFFGGGCGTVEYVVHNDTLSTVSVTISVVPDGLAIAPSQVTVPAMAGSAVDVIGVANVPTPGLYSVSVTFALDGQTVTRTMILNVRATCLDAFASAVVISGANGTLSGVTIGTTGETGEPNHAGASTPLNSVWCKWTAPASGAVSFDTTGSLFNTTLAVYTGSSVSALTPVASNNDISASNLQSRVTFNAVQGVTYRIAVDGAGAATGVYLLNWAQAASGTTTFAAVLPYARSVTTGTPATAFATIINGGGGTATGCGLAQPPGFPGSFSYQTTNAANQLTGSPNTPVNIGPGAAQSYVFAITPDQEFSGAEVAVVFDCTNTPVTVSVPGLNTFLLSSSSGATPDLVAVGATPSGDGIVDIPGATGTGFFAAAAVNIGAAGTITATADDAGKGLPVNLSICQTNPSTGQCINPSTPGPSATVSVSHNQTVTFTVFATGTAPVTFDPANNRLFLRLKDAVGITRGATNVAVRTQ